jgi:2,3-bisphosphoglycerate-dependent phosphoglycerate mutase
VLRHAAPAATQEPDAHAVLILLRHGQSVWNEASLFTGWADVELTTLGKNEAAQGATSLWKAGYKVDVAYTSLLKRAQQTLDIVLKITGQEDVTVHQSWRLNERMYGGLTGLNKKETVAKYGEDQVKKWRRSYSDPPPPIETTSPYWPGNDNKYAHIPEEEIPLAECLKDTVERCLPYWQSDITPALERGKTVLVAAHGNSIRGILKYLDNISDEDITGLEIPTGIPLVYELDKNLKPIKLEGSVPPLNGRFLADLEALKKAQEEVANQSKLRYGVEA